jgi:long-chain fatty acid transport protein
MRTIIATAFLGLAFGGSAVAGGLERINPTTSILFEDGNYIEFNWAYLSPDVSGQVTANVPPLFTPGSQSGDMLGGYSLPSLAYKHDFGRGFTGMLRYNRPYGANTYYGSSQANYFANINPYEYFGAPANPDVALAKLSTDALTAVLMYTTDTNISVYGGVRYQEMEANATVPFVFGYNVSADRTGAWGYLLGAAWEKPEIAARVSITYYSKIDHDFDNVHETGFYPIGSPLQGQTYDVTTSTTVSTPQAVSLEFQSGVAADTLVFGSILWTNWKDFKIAPTQYGLVTGGAALDDYAYDSWTYSLGIGRKFTDKWSGALTAAWEPSDGSLRKNLGPRDGYTRLGVAATYAVGKVEITGGLSYFWIGDTKTAAGPVSPATEFKDNTAFGGGVRIGYRF